MADAAGARWAKLLGARAEAHARLRLGELRRLLAVCAEFTRACEALGARPLVGLRTALAVRHCRFWADTRASPDLGVSAAVHLTAKWYASLLTNGGPLLPAPGSTMPPTITIPAD